MPDVFDANGLEIKTLSEIRTELETALKAVYGVDINVEQNSPDGQQINIYSQGAIDLRELLQQLNASFDPDQAQGVSLDQRVALNGIIRNVGTFTFQEVAITTDRAITLVGLDTEATELIPDIEDLYTVRDSVGNQFFLLDTEVIAAAGTYSLLFRAAELGRVETLPNTITTPVTVFAGVTGINNPAGPTSIGVDEETDAELRIRRRASISIASKGYLDSIESALANLENVSEAIVYENDTDFIDVNGTPPHSIWAIVDGGDPDEIAQVIYAKKSAGAGTRGAQSVTIIRPNGADKVITYDEPISQDLYIQFEISPALSGTAETDLKAAIVAGVSWAIGGRATSDVLTCFVKNFLGSGFVVLDMEVSDDGVTYSQNIITSGLNYRFLNDVARIDIL